MELTLSLFATGFSIIVVIWCLNNLKFSGGVKIPGPYWEHLYFQIPIMILPSIIALHAFDFKELWLYDGLTSQEINSASIWVVYGVVSYCLGLIIFQRLIFNVKLNKSLDSDVSVCLLVPVTILILLFVVFWKVGDLPLLHFGALDVGIIRKNVTTSANFSPYYKSAITYLSYFGMAYAGSVYSLNKKKSALVLIVISAVGLMWSGEKAPLIKGLLTLYFSYSWFAKIKVNVYRLFFLSVIGFFIVWLLYRFTLPNVEGDDLLELVFARLLLAQMSGFYQAYSVSSPNINYVLGWLPFSGLLYKSVPIYSKDFMIQLYGETDTNGYYNSIFLQDAWGALGHFGLIISPFVMAASIMLSFYILSCFLKRVAGQRFLVCCFFSFLNVNTITASFGQFAFLKAIIFPCVLFFFLALACRIVRLKVCCKL